jgi:Flp pilus assembly protein TadD
LVRRFGSLLLILFVLSLSAPAADLRINLPKRSKPTPVQKYNREGVKALKKHKYEKAKRLFYRAYLLDPNDPFTLNNLGYVAELEGEIERAQRFYALAAENSSEAWIDSSTNKDLKGKAVAEVAGKTVETGIQINRMNVAAMALLLKDRAAEADQILSEALKLDPANPFTLNNMGYAKEVQGELEAALGYYRSAANRRSDETVIVAVEKDWRGKSISEIAARNADKVRELMDDADSVEARVRRLNLRGVSALNRNDARTARTYFEQAYKLSPNDPFTLNNLGYVSELDGDNESAEFYYAKSREHERSDAKVDVASRREAEGRSIGAVAGENDAAVEQQIQALLAAKRRQGGPVVLKRRDGTPAGPPADGENEEGEQQELPASDEPQQQPDEDTPRDRQGRPIPESLRQPVPRQQ